jgi:uncharacterized protein (DUF2235 family)
VKRLVICCDGTWNRPDEIHDGIRVPTNVAKVALGLARADPAGVEQVLFYQQGVGTRPGERLRGGAFGFGLSRNVRDCYRFVVETYEPGDELCLLGFSRGAFTARSTVGLIRNSGILRRDQVARIDDAYRLYRDRSPSAHPNGLEAEIFRRMYAHPDFHVRFIGVWDTVGALGIPIDGFRPPFAERLWGFHDTTLSSYVANAHQALAIDERRGPFVPTLWQQQPGSTGQTLEQVWFSGVHSDVGGGYREPALSEIALLWMVQRAAACGIAFEPGHFQVAAGAVEPEARERGEQIAPDALGTIHESRDGLYKLLAPHVRSLGDGDGQSVASSAVRRTKELAGYDPPTLRAYLADPRHPAPTPVIDGGPTP